MQKKKKKRENSDGPNGDGKLLQTKENAKESNEDRKKERKKEFVMKKKVK